MNKIKISLKTFLSDYIDYHKDRLKIDEETKMIKISIRRLNEIKTLIEHQLPNVTINSDKDNVLSLSNEANKNFIWDDRQRSLLCNREYFNQVTSITEMTEEMFKVYESIMKE